MTKEHYTWFDRWVAAIRYRAAERHIAPDSRLCDVGCGVDALFLKRLVPRTRSRVGLDYQEIWTKFRVRNFSELMSQGRFRCRMAISIT